METDILVVGGGPAGVLSAITASKMGVNVILIDPKKREEIGNKTCGDAIDLAPLDFLHEKIGLKLPENEEIADIVEALMFKTEKVEFPVSGDGFVLNRHEYGQRLLKEAEDSGVKILSEMRAVKSMTDGDKVIGVTVKNKKTSEKSEIHAKVTIDCSGRDFIVRKTLPANDFPRLEKMMKKRDTAAAYREIIKLNENLPNHPYMNKIFLIYQEEVPEPAYWWIFSKGDHRLNIGLGWSLDMKIDKPMKALFQEVLATYYKKEDYTVEHAKGNTIPTRYALSNSVASGFLTAGDAAFHANPLTAEGHGPALVAGYYAGKVSAEAIKEKDYSEKNLWKYNKLVLDHIGRSNTKVQIFAEALRSVKVKGLEFIFKRKILTQEEFANLNKGVKPSFFQIILKAIRIFPHYGLLFKMYKMANFAIEIDKHYDNFPDDPKDFLEWNKDFSSTMNRVIEEI